MKGLYKIYIYLIYLGNFLDFLKNILKIDIYLISLEIR